jgi:hypothetical protein
MWQYWTNGKKQAHSHMKICSRQSLYFNLVGKGNNSINGLKQLIIRVWGRKN